MTFGCWENGIIRSMFETSRVNQRFLVHCCCSLLWFQTYIQPGPGPHFKKYLVCKIRNMGSDVFGKKIKNSLGVRTRWIPSKSYTIALGQRRKQNKKLNLDTKLTFLYTGPALSLYSSFRHRDIKYNWRWPEVKIYLVICSPWVRLDMHFKGWWRPLGTSENNRSWATRTCVSSEPSGGLLLLLLLRTARSPASDDVQT